MKIFSNGFVVFVPRYAAYSNYTRKDILTLYRFGIEGLIRTKDLGTPEPETEYDGETYELTVKDKTSFKVALCDKVKVTVQDEKDEKTGKRKIQLTLVR